MDIWTTILALATAYVALGLLVWMIIFAIIWKFRKNINHGILTILGLLFVIAGIFASPSVVGLIVLVVIGVTLIDLGLQTKLFYPRIERIVDQLPIVGKVRRK